MAFNRKLAIRIVAALGAAGLLLGTWAFWIEPASLRNESHDIFLSSWPSECDGLRLVVLADLHVGSPFNGLDKLDRIVDLANAAEPDIVLLAGDFMISNVPGGTLVEPEAIAFGLARLTVAAGVYAMLGNHDWWYDGERVRNALTDAGIAVLEDASQQLRVGGCSMWLAGISDFWESDHDIGRALAGVPEGAAVVAFTHNPDVFPDVPKRVALTVAGHTHGGQVCLPLAGRLVVPSEYGERYALGHVVENGRHLFVSSGLGTSILPVRFLVPPEVSVLTLRSAAAASAQ